MWKQKSTCVFPLRFYFRSLCHLGLGAGFKLMEISATAASAKLAKANRLFVLLREEYQKTWWVPSTFRHYCYLTCHIPALAAAMAPCPRAVGQRSSAILVTAATLLLKHGRKFFSHSESTTTTNRNSAGQKISDGKTS